MIVLQRIKCLAMRGRGLIVVFGLLLVGCSTPSVHFMREGVEATSLIRIDQEWMLERLWRGDVGGGYREADSILHVSVDGETIYVAHPSGVVAAWVGETGKELWRRQLSGRIMAGTGVGSKHVVVVDDEGVVRAMRTADGVDEWRQNAGAQVLARPVVSGAVVLLRTGGGQMLAIETVDGSVRWRNRHRVPELTLRGVSEPLSHGGRALAGLANGRLSSIDLVTGQTIWKVAVDRARGSNEITRLIDLDSRPAIVGNVLFAGAYQGRMVALEVATGESRWSRKVSVLRDLGADDSGIYAVTSQSEVVGLRLNDGAELWRQSALRGRGLTAPSVLPGAIAVGDYKGYLHLLDSVDGRFLGRIRLDTEAIISITSAKPDRLYVASESGRVTAVRVASAEPG